jgi:CRISPR system Cascade subunit CasE
MIISKIALKNCASHGEAFWKMFGSEYSLHQAIWDLFADDPDRRRDFIYRVDSIGKWPSIYTVSQRAPKDNRELWDMVTKPYDPHIHNGMKMGFSVRVNPTCKRDDKRHDVVMDMKYKLRSKDKICSQGKSMAEIVIESCEKWLTERSQKNGFKVLQVRIDGYQQMRFFKAKGGTPIQYSTVDFAGILEVMDEGLFKKVLFDGLGPEKGFGCGLMLVRKI